MLLKSWTNTKLPVCHDSDRGRLRMQNERLDRLESLAAIQQLAVRYALAVDSRDMDALVDLFVPDVRVGRDEHGRDALKAWYTTTLRHRRPRCTSWPTTSSTSTTPIMPAASSTAAMRSRCPETRAGVGSVLGSLSDRGEWYFERRKLHRWYMVDALTRPSHGAGVDDTLPCSPERWSRGGGSGPKRGATDVRG